MLMRFFAVGITNRFQIRVYHRCITSVNARCVLPAALDYEVNVRTWRLVNKLDGRLDDLVARLERLESRPDAGGHAR